MKPASIEAFPPGANPIVDALRDPTYDFRTPEGIARETGLSIETVGDFLIEHSEIVRRPVVPDKSGRDLYTVADRSLGWRERYRRIRQLLATW